MKHRSCFEIHLTTLEIVAQILNKIHNKKHWLILPLKRILRETKDIIIYCVNGMEEEEKN